MPAGSLPPHAESRSHPSALRPVFRLALFAALLVFPLALFSGCGEDGETGPQGPQGLIGEQGSDGPQGPAGPQGSDGPQGPAGPAGADGSVAWVFQDGGGPTAHYQGTRDTYIDSQQPIYNFALGHAAQAYYPGQIDVGHAPGSYVHRGLIRFDVAELVPSDVVVTAAYLVLYAASCGGEPTIGAYALTHAWDEGTGNGTSEGYANWGDAYSWQAWTAAGGDYEPTLLDSESMSLGFPKRQAPGAAILELIELGWGALADGIVPKYCAFRIPASLVQNWIDEPSENYGLLLKSVDETIAWGQPGGGAVAFTGREWTTGSQRPRLILYCRLP